MVKVKNIFKEQNVGFGEKSLYQGDRLLNSNGEFNVKRRGMPLLKRIDIFYFMVGISWSYFYLIIFALFFLINFSFGIIYMSIGIEHLTGLVHKSFWENAWECFFFSAQTFTSVGYGRVAPTGFWISLIASFEAMIGLMSFAVATGLLYGRFSRPRAKLMFSDNIILSPYKEDTALMFRFINKKQNTLTDAEVRVTLSMEDKTVNPPIRRFYYLEPEFKNINFLSLNWTVVHHINDQSPLFQMKMADLQESKAEFIISIQAFDSTFSQVIQARHSYTWTQLKEGYKFARMYFPSENGSGTIMEIDKLSDIEKV